MTATGIHAHERFKLGLIPHDKTDEQLVSINWVGDTPPTAPVEVDNMSGITPGLDGNDHYGDCGPTSGDNHNRVTTYAYGKEVDATLAEVLDLYAASSNPPFNPQTGANDNGVQMPDLLNAMRKVGLGGKKLVGFGRLKDTSLPSIKAAISLFGAVLFAVDLQTAQQSQTSASPPVWDYSPSGEWGGHAICAAKYDASGVYVISWAMIVRLTQAFMTHQLGEVWVPLWQEVVNSDVFAKTVAVADLASQFKSLTGSDWPAAAPPTPTPTPTPAGVASFPGARADVDAKIVATAKREGLSVTDYQNKIWMSHFHLKA